MGKPVNQEFSAAMTKPIKTAKALNLLLQGQRVADVLLLDIETQKSGFRDALLLTENGFVVPIVSH